MDSLIFPGSVFRKGVSFVERFLRLAHADILAADLARPAPSPVPAAGRVPTLEARRLEFCTGLLYFAVIMPIRKAIGEHRIRTTTRDATASLDDRHHPRAPREQLTAY